MSIGTVMNYFTVEELSKSDVATKCGIDNTPKGAAWAHLLELIVTLNSIREAWGSPIRVNSGYRCPRLNKAVCGSSTSVHMIGYAADLWPVNGDFDGFVECIKRWAAAHDFDQLLIEKNTRGGRWVHVGLFNNAHEQRHQIKLMSVR